LVGLAIKLCGDRSCPTVLLVVVCILCFFVSLFAKGTSNFKQQQQQWCLPQGHRHPCKHNDCENNNSVATMRPSSNPFFMFALFSCCLSIVDYKNGKTTEEQSITTMVV
jgi:hypothetical protein